MIRKKHHLWFSLILIFTIAGCNSVAPALSTPLAGTPTPTEAVLAPIELVNPGFEEVDASGAPVGWSSSGDMEAVLVEDKGQANSALRLSHQASASYMVETTQSVTGLADAWYTLGAWVRSSGRNEVKLSLICGGVEKSTYAPSTLPGYRWLHLVVSNQAVDGSCTIRLSSFGLADSWASFDNLTLDPGQTALSILGADISSLKKSEDLGGQYFYEDGSSGDALQIMQDAGLNYARLRIWVDPADGYHNKAEILAMATRLHEKGIKLLVDFHYSDNWADPGKQNKPAAWADLDFEGLKQAVYDHTYDVCSSLVAQGTPPDMVQLGNEISAGMLWPDGDYNHFDNLADLLKAGAQAMQDCSPETLIMLHIPEGGDNDLARWWFDAITHREVPFDIIGVSYYPFWHGSLAQLQTNLNDISARYDKDVIVAEFAYPFTGQEGDQTFNIFNRAMGTEGYLITPEGQRMMLRDVMSVVRGVQGGRGLGVFYWEATWTVVDGNGWDSTDPASGNSWENQALFDYSSRLLPAMKEYLNP